MRVGVLCHNYPPHPGGLEVMVQTVARHLARRHRVILVTTGWGGVGGVSEEDGVCVHRIPALHLSERFGVPWPLPYGPGVAAARRALDQAEVLHAHGALYATSLLAARLARRSRRPLILTEHVGFVSYRRAAVNAIQSGAWAAVGDRVVAAAHDVTSYNQRVIDWLSERYPEREIRFVGNGVDAVAFRPRSAPERTELRSRLGLPPDERLVLFVGRESEKKNLEFVLGLPRDGFRLVVCGARRRLPAEVVDLGILPHGRMPELYGAVDLMVNPTAGEGFPLAVQEAMASALPVVLLWDPGYGRWLDRDIPSSADSLAEVAASVARLVGDGEARVAIGAREREWVERRWSWETTARAYEEIYERSLVEGTNG